MRRTVPADAPFVAGRNAPLSSPGRMRLYDSSAASLRHDAQETCERGFGILEMRSLRALRAILRRREDSLSSQADRREITFAEQMSARDAASRRAAWIVAAAASILALAEAFALASLVPLKSTEPVVITVDRTTGEVDRPVRVKEAVDYAPEEAVAKSFLHRFVERREGFMRERAEEDFLYVSLFLDSRMKERWAAFYRPANPDSPLNLEPGVEIEARVLSISFLRDGLASVRFRRRIKQSVTERDEHWTATVGYKFSPAQMKERDLWRNPLGMQVSAYRRDPEVDR